MEMHEYQKKAGKYANYPQVGFNLVYPTLGLAGESGEVAEKVKKLIRDHNCTLSEEYRLEIVKELGDVLWYVAAMARELKVDLDYVASVNLEKLESRYQRKLLSGEGDNR